MSAQKEKLLLSKTETIVWERNRIRYFQVKNPRHQAHRVLRPAAIRAPVQRDVQHDPGPAEVVSRRQLGRDGSLHQVRRAQTRRCCRQRARRSDDPRREKCAHVRDWRHVRTYFSSGNVSLLICWN